MWIYVAPGVFYDMDIGMSKTFNGSIIIYSAYSYDNYYSAYSYDNYGSSGYLSFESKNLEQKDLDLIDELVLTRDGANFAIAKAIIDNKCCSL
jgi:hypothetical protein